MNGRLVLAAAIALCAVPAPAPAAGVTIYRCTDAKGQLTLRDTPCRKGERQETRAMVRPKDAPRRPAPEPPRAAQEAVAPTRVVVVSPPRPMYECVTPDGERYTSETGDGNPRWVPLWTLGYPVHPVRAHEVGGTNIRVTGRHFEITSGTRHVGPVGPVFPPAAYGAGTWIRDQCHALPPAEACARMVDRRDAIRRRFFNAMPSERDVLRVEERGINARLANDCSNY
jgi:hypothetical protein